MHLLITTVLFCFCCYAPVCAQDASIEVRLLQPIINILPGQVAQVQAEVINRSCHQHLLIGHLELPPLWEAVPSNDLLLHIERGQRAIQTVMIKAPESATPGEFPIAYEVWVRDNASILGRDTAAMVIGERTICTPIGMEITSDAFLEINPGEVVFLSLLVQNYVDSSFEGHVALSLPDQWTCFPSEKSELVLEGAETKVLIYGIKIPQNALAGEHALTLCLDGYADCKKSVVVIVKPKIDISGTVDGLCEAFNINQMTPLHIRYANKGNIAIKAVLTVQTQPECSIEFSSDPFEILPNETCDIPIRIKPETCQEEYVQFLMVKLIDAETGEQLYQNPMTLKFVLPGTQNDNRYQRIPAYFKMMALGDRYNKLLAAEFAGEGMIDPEKQRYLEFFFRAPTETNHVIYNINEELYAGLYDPEWDLWAGDTIYELSPLTQRFRYGRGAGINHYGETWDTGLQYVQNTPHCDQESRELCGYLQYNSCHDYSLSVNYLHRVQECIPTSNIVTLRAAADYPTNFTTEVEFGKNFVHENSKKTWAYRFETHGRLWEDSWFSFEKAYAGSEFFGYYNNLNLLSSSLDLPVSNKWRLNLSVNRFRQEIPVCCDDDEPPTIPRQHQYAANLTYCVNSNCSFAFNSLFLKADDRGERPQYDFFQKWYGCSFFGNLNGYNLNAFASFGREKNYLTHETSNWLQRYYAYLSKNLSTTLRASLFYDTGNINYYDPRPWSIGYGGSLSYRFSPQGSLEIFMQRIKHTCDNLNLSQFTLNFNYTFANRHRLEAFAQYYYYKSHFPNDLLFIVSYSIPFSLPVCRRKDVGDLTGWVYNEWDQVPVSEAMVKCHQNHATSNASGAFQFPCLPKGEHVPKVVMLPDDLIEVGMQANSVDIPGGSEASLCIPVVPACSIRGEIILYGYKDLFAVLIDPQNAEIVPMKGMESIRVAISRNNGEEIYACLTSDKGGFEFPKLRPGRWHIKIFTNELPDLHALDMNELEIDILPKENRYLQFKVTPTAPQVFKIE